MIRLLIPVMGLLMLASCRKNRVFEEYHSIDNMVWNYRDTAVFEVEIDDTTTYYHWLVMLRHHTGYRFSNAYVMAEVSGPGDFKWSQSLDIITAEPDGRWVGKRGGSMVEVLQPFRVRAIMPYTGRYTFRLTQYMRMDEAPGISDIGLQVMRGGLIY